MVRVFMLPLVTIQMLAGLAEKCTVLEQLFGSDDMYAGQQQQECTRNFSEPSTAAGAPSPRGCSLSVPPSSHLQYVAPVQPSVLQQEQSNIQVSDSCAANAESAMQACKHSQAACSTLRQHRQVVSCWQLDHVPDHQLQSMADDSLAVDSVRQQLHQLHGLG
jgi:hypothetical protein